MIVTLIRHTSVDVPPGMCYGQTDVPLTPSFPEEAAVVRKNLEDENFGAVYTSPLSRCVKLAAYCGFPDARRDDRIKELHFGDWEMLYYDQINDPRLATWYKDPMNVAATNGESFGQQYSRVAAFLDELKKNNDSPPALFTHGGTILCAQVYAGILNPAEAFRFLTPYGGIVKIEI
jgi:alpha-ribazole phosphatase